MILKMEYLGIIKRQIYIKIHNENSDKKMMKD